MSQVFYELVIGLEVHAQMNTKTKLFCGCDNDAFGKSPNTTVCPVCMGHPGALPVPNEVALQKAVKAGKALGCTIAQDHHLDRKNYFYPDLPAGYQISQYQYPLAAKGLIRFGDGKECRITRLHIENDAGKLVHEGGRSYCDYNRAGTPLMEIVTEPDLRSAEDAVAFAQELRRILITVDASEADMYKGMMRFDASISLRPKGDTKLYPRAEIKNLNSFKSLEKALIFEEKRLRQLWEAGTPPTGEVTVHWDDDREEAKVMRQKESAADYRYFPEPDIPPFHFEQAYVDACCGGSIELPGQRRARYESLKLEEAEIILLTDQPRLAEYFDAVLAATDDAKRTKSIVLTQLLGFLKAAEKDLAQGPSADQVIALLRIVDAGTISANTAKAVLEKMVHTGNAASAIIAEEGLQQISDTSVIEDAVRKAIAANPKAVMDYKSGNERALGAIVGYVMKETKGQADPGVVSAILGKMLE